MQDFQKQISKHNMHRKIRISEVPQKEEWDQTAYDARLQAPSRGAETHNKSGKRSGTRGIPHTSLHHYLIILSAYTDDR